jgi:hypothetical protein
LWQFRQFYTMEYDKNIKRIADLKDKRKFFSTIPLTS